MAETHGEELARRLIYLQSQDQNEDEPEALVEDLIDTVLCMGRVVLFLWATLIPKE